MSDPRDDYLASGRGSRHLIIGAGVAAGVVIAFAGAMMSGPYPTLSTAEQRSASAAGRPAVGRDGEISRESFAANGLTWPFTVDRGRIGCEQGLPYFEDEGVRYALNGRARARWPYAEPVLQTDDSLPPDRNGWQARVNPRDVLDEARKLCDEEAARVIGR
ncbi:MAG: hypothetical protein ACK40O_00905 [Allosphingosinicella sp.]